MKITALVGIMLTCALCGLAQTKPVDKQLEEMTKLSFLIGKWKGEGWIQAGPRERESFTQTEDVVLKLEGKVIVIEGIGKSKRPEAAGQIVHNALAIVSYDLASEKYLWRAYTKDGRTLDVRAKLVGEKSLEWGFDMPQAGSVRYTITLDAQNRWTEVGEFSRDGGKTWMKNFEMTLQKTQ